MHNLIEILYDKQTFEVKIDMAHITTSAVPHFGQYKLCSHKTIIV